MKDLLVGHFRIQELDIQRHLRMRPGEGAQQRRQAMQADVVAGGEGQPTADVAAQVGQCAARIVEHVEDAIGARQQGATGFGEADFAAQAVEQAHLELLLEGGDAFAHRRLGQVQAFTGYRETAGFGHGDEGIEVGEVHGRSLERALWAAFAGVIAQVIPGGNASDEKDELELSRRPL